YYSYKLAHDNRFDAYVQRINPDGTLPWGITGMDFDTNQTNYEQEIQVGHSDGSQYIWALCRYTDATQGQVGVYLQKFDKITGARLLTDNAKEIYAIGNTAPSPAGNFRVTASDAPIFLTNNGTNLEVNLLDDNGDFVWPEETKPVATFNAAKSRVYFNPKDNTEAYVLTFNEDKGSGEKVYAQNFTDDELLSTESFDADVDIKYLNPVSDMLTIKSSKPLNSIVIYNNLGQLVASKNNINNNSVVINSQNWTAGLYYATLVVEHGGKNTIKIIKH
ncbi:MAG: T9SS type A sorting domain-containing protein, partial [Putridiphycobacter sp.]|nr:T9SS type A sorting domain-containing protein [Putridiphycobacter sp.]